MADRIVWLASYPKSGSTWVRLFLEALGQRPIPHAADRGWMGGQDRVAACRTLAPGATTVIKIHDACTPDVVPPAYTRAAIYLVRDPRDVALSFAAHLGRTSGQAAEVMACDRSTLLGNRFADQFPQRLCTWSQHVASWLTAPFPVLVVRYEDLLAAPRAWFPRLARVVDAAATDDAIARARDAVRFERLRAAEEADGFAERSPHATRFFRAGTAGQWRDGLDPRLARLMHRQHGAMMQRVGYSAEGVS